MPFLQSLASLLGRWVLAWFFLTEAYRHALEWNSTAVLLTMKGLPAPQIVLALAIAGAVLGSVSLILGLWTRVGALVKRATSRSTSWRMSVPELVCCRRQAGQLRPDASR